MFLFGGLGTEEKAKLKVHTRGELNEANLSLKLDMASWGLGGEKCLAKPVLAQIGDCSCHRKI